MRRLGPDRNRGQLVLVAAGVLALALVPIAFAYLQLGYHADVRAGVEYDDPGRNAERLLERGVHDASADVRGEYEWWQREDAVAAVRTNLEPRLETLRAARVDSGTAYEVAYNDSAAAAWAARNCPSGPDRQFGDCEAIDGVVVQERAGEAAVLAVALDVRVTTADGRWRATPVVEATGNATATA
ncbi:DUF7261 family protein [Halostella salina]|uniref:DUF7261 family protein n=1 Tax=Halostella salina TaxID=1547897 RepID=UPI000EF82C85|nr:hypothetical protein [Halostella salina]